MPASVVSSGRRRMGRLLAVAATMTLAVAGPARADQAVAPGSAQALAAVGHPEPLEPSRQALFDLDSAPPAQTDPETRPVELGVQLTVTGPALAEGIAFYRPLDRPPAPGARVTLWRGDERLATGTASGSGGTGWVRVGFADGPVVLQPGSSYTASYTATGGYAVTEGFFERPLNGAGGWLRAPRLAGVYAYPDGDEVVRPTRVYAASNYWVTVYGQDLDRGPWSLFGAGVTVGNPIAGDDADVELGVRFRARRAPVGDYEVTAVRFYRGATAAMVDNRVFVYDDAGEVVARGRFIGEGGPSGVVDVLLSAPLRIEPGRTYTASYLAEGGRYAYDLDAFDAPRSAGPVVFPERGGVYRYGGGFPTATHRAADYFVSPVVRLRTGDEQPPPPPPRDQTVPVVTLQEPADGATVPAGAFFYVRAAVTDAGSVMTQATVLVDDVVIDRIPNPSNGAIVNFPVRLEPGPHVIRIRAVDPAGNIGEAVLRVVAAPTP